jgi:hypothetical protein
MTVTVPANMAGAPVINARLAAAIVYLRGYDPKDPHVRTVATFIAVGSNAQQIAKEIGIEVGEKVVMQAIKNLPIMVIREINKMAGFMLLAKYGSKRAVVTLAKGAPPGRWRDRRRGRCDHDEHCRPNRERDVPHRLNVAFSQLTPSQRQSSPIGGLERRSQVRKNKCVGWSQATGGMLAWKSPRT